MLWASQVAPGNENNLKLRVYGTKAGLEWCQENPNNLWVGQLGQPKRLVTRGGAGAGAAAARVTRVPPGHPEGYLEGFATIYREAADAIVAGRKGKRADKACLVPDGGGRGEGRRLHRGVHQIERPQRGVGEAVA